LLNKKRKICFVTGTRAEYGLLYWLLKEVQDDPDLLLQIIVTGAHLSPEYGLTYKAIEEDGFKINEKVEMLLSSDSAVGIAKSIGLATIGFADAFAQLKPDLVVLLGDRYELLAAAQTALVAATPIAHIAGGDTTEGAYDEAIRHSITKMSHLHFVTNELSAKRVRQLGENPSHIYCVGNPGLDYIRKLNFLSKDELEHDLGVTFGKRIFLITFHPVTLSPGESANQFAALLQALECFEDLNTMYIFTMPNADNDGRLLSTMVERFCSGRTSAIFYKTLGQKRYLSLLSHVDLIVGNSSSGLYEAPSLKVPTVNIGDRQKGRLKAASVVDCQPDREAIQIAIKEALSLDCSKVTNPYGDGYSSERVIKVLREIKDYKRLLKKHFFDMGNNNE